MSHQKDDNLDRLLRYWATREQADEAHLESLRRRISQAADELEGAGTEAVGIPGHDPAAGRRRKALLPATWSSRLTWFTLGAAAAILAAVVLVSRWGPHRAEDIPAEQLAEVPPEVRLDRRQLAAQAKLLAAMKEVFAGRLTWLAESDGKVILGIEPENQPSPDGSQPITIRLVVMARRPGEATWHRRFSVDCIVQNEQLVELAPQDGSGAQLALWAHLLPDGMIAVDISLGLGAGGEGRDPQPSTLNTQLFEPQVPRQIMTLKTDGTEYQVFQTVAVLPKEVG